VTAPKLPIPSSSGYATISLSTFVAIAVIVKHLWVPKKYWVWVPNWNAVGLVSTPIPIERTGVISAPASGLHRSWDAILNCHGLWFPLCIYMVEKKPKGESPPTTLAVFG
jgi:cell shape-determining protein MreD